MMLEFARLTEKHPHERGEDSQRWTTRYRLHRNTPTSVGKTEDP